MNHSVSHPAMNNSVPDKDEDAFDLVSYIEMFIDNRWVIASITALVTAFGVVYALMATPIYQANMLVQVEENASPSASVFGNLAGAFEMKSAATAEIEILRSRLVLGRAITNAGLNLSVEPQRFPVIGAWIARGSNKIKDVGIFGLGGFTWGGEHADIATFSIPQALEGKEFELTVTGKNTYRIIQEDYGIDVIGNVGQVLKHQSANGSMELHVSKLAANEGAKFVIVRQPMLDTIQNLQQALTITERGKQSGVLGLSLDGPNPVLTARILNEIGLEYISQNVERKSEEAQKSLTFLEKQLPEMKSQVEAAEERYNTLRNRRGTVDLGEEAKTVLQQSIQSQTKLVELKQRRDELLTRYQPVNPVVRAVDQQIATLNAELASINSKIKRMPEIEQDVLRLTRDIKVSTDLYISLLNSTQQLRLVKASKVGNARLLDEAVAPRYPARPKRGLIVVVAAVLGLAAGVVFALVKKSAFGGIEEPHEIEQHLGLTVSTAIPHSNRQDTLSSQLKDHVRKVSVLAQDDPSDLAIEALRSFRTSLQFSMLGAKNKIVMITGPTPGVGKSFVSVNFATVLASAGKKVLLIDADLRKGYLQRYFGVDRHRGLSEVISGELNLEQSIHHNVVPNVDLISTGVLPPRPAELLEHRNFADILNVLTPQYDVIVIDTAPILAVTDAMIVAPHVGTIFNVVRGGVSTIGEIGEAVKRLRNSGHDVAGVVFNDLKHRTGRYGFASKYGKYRYEQYKY